MRLATPAAAPGLPMPAYEILSDRWLEGHPPSPVIDGIAAMVEAEAGALDQAKEMFFVARSAAHGLGILIEFEFDDDHEPSAERTERVRAAMPPTILFEYVPPDGPDVFMERAAYWAFLPLNHFSCATIEAAAVAFDA